MANDSTKGRFFTEVPYEEQIEILDRYDNGRPIRDLEFEYFVMPGTLRAYIDEIRPKRKTTYPDSVVEIQKICEDYKANIPRNRICGKYNITKRVLTNIANNYGLRRTRVRKKKIEEEVEEMNEKKTYDVICLNEDLTYKESIRWAMKSAGEWTITGQDPKTCPCYEAWFLYTQAKDDPKSFMGIARQVEAKITDEGISDVQKETVKTVKELDCFLSDLVKKAPDNKVVSYGPTSNSEAVQISEANEVRSVEGHSDEV